jgi:hypothetical protein
MNTSSDSYDAAADGARNGFVSVDFLYLILDLCSDSGRLTWKHRDVSMFDGHGWQKERACGRAVGKDAAFLP